MDKNTEKALNNLIIKIDELINEMENEDLNSEEKISRASVYFNVFKFIKKEDYEHNIAVLDNDRIKRKFNIQDLDL